MLRQRLRQRYAAAILLGVTATAVWGLVWGLGPATQSAHAVSWQPSQSQLTVGIRVAHEEATTTIPTASGAPIISAPEPDEVGWPSNVDSVVVVMSTRAVAEQWVDGSVPDTNQDVVVVRMMGHFSVSTTGPPGSVGYATGTRMTVVADAATGQVIDFGLDDGAATPIPGQQTVFNP